MIKLPKGIQDNLQFLCVEIDAQLANMQLYFEQGLPRIANQILERTGYAYNLKTRIHSSVINQLVVSDLDSQTIFRLRHVEFIANDLERIADICRSCIAYSDQLKSFEGMQPKSYIRVLKQAQSAIRMVVPAIEHSDSTLAIEIGQVNEFIVLEHQKLIDKQRSTPKSRKNTEQVTSAIYIAYELKQLGTALIHISESIISANLGQSVSYDRYTSLQSLVEELDSSHQKLQIQTVAETRSGAAISGISSPESGSLGIYKSGQKQKLKDEKEGVKSWHEIYPGLAPKILSYQKKGGSAALLIEHLPGYTFEKIVLNQSTDMLKNAQERLFRTLRSIWAETQVAKNAEAKYMQQLQKRLPEVYKIHPEFYKEAVNICGQPLLSFETLISKVAELEQQYIAPFSVYIHGDFNVDNIIYDPVEKRINFIDLHRSCYMDYVQDISVFMVSNYRLQIFDSPRRNNMMAVARNVYAMARRYAVKHDDKSFEPRLALGLARSFATSTRFILDKALAKEMFLRARYLIELVLAIEPEKVARFRIPLKEIFVE
jgi:aminoglycoside phosphotransferase